MHGGITAWSRHPAMDAGYRLAWVTLVGPAASNRAPSPLCILAICLAAGIHVHDGDTILRGPDRIRIAGIRAPELSEPGGIASRDYLRALVAGRPLACDSHGRDRYGRRVATCYLPDGQDIACEMVGAGHARDWPKYSGGRYARCGRE